MQPNDGMAWREGVVAHTKVEPSMTESKEPSLLRSASTISSLPGRASARAGRWATVEKLRSLTVALTWYPLSRSCFVSSVPAKPPAHVCTQYVTTPGQLCGHIPKDAVPGKRVYIG